MKRSLPVVLTIAGSDSIGGAGIQADLKALAFLGTHGTSVLTALTAQNTLGVTAIHAVPGHFVEAQLRAVFSDLRPDAIKTGMLANAEIIQTVRTFLQEEASDIPLVVDPVLIAATGARLLEVPAENALQELFQQATLVTPNLPEAAALTEKPLPTSLSEMESLLHTLAQRYPGPAWLLKGGHADWQDQNVISLLFYEGRTYTFSHPRIPLNKPPHGTGCTLASAIAAFLAHGFSLPESVEKALLFTYQAVAHADPTLGKGALLLRPLPFDPKSS